MTFKFVFLREGFEDERIESILHRVELSQKHQTSNFGLGVISVSRTNFILTPT